MNLQDFGQKNKTNSTKKAEGEESPQLNLLSFKKQGVYLNMQN